MTILYLIEPGEPVPKEMNKNAVLGLSLYIAAVIVGVVALFSSDWVVSKHIGTALNTLARWLKLCTIPSFLSLR